MACGGDSQRGLWGSVRLPGVKAAHGIVRPRHVSACCVRSRMRQVLPEGLAVKFGGPAHDGIVPLHCSRSVAEGATH